MPDTRKDAIDVVAKGYGRLTPEARQRFERQASSFNFLDFVHAKEAREHFLRRLFTAIGHDALETGEARERLDKDTAEDAAQNERPFVVRFRTGNVGPYDWIKDLDGDLPANAALIAAIDVAKNLLALGPNATASPGLTLGSALEILRAVERTLNGHGVNTQLRIYGEGVLAQGCNRIIDRKLLPEPADDSATENFLRLLRIATSSVGPIVEDHTEKSFEENASWSSPAARVEAAQTVFDLVLQRPDLLWKFPGEIDTLLADPHPAVRMQAGLHLICIWDLDRAGFWRRLTDRVNREPNLGVLEHIINRVLNYVMHSAPEIVESLTLELLTRFPDDNERQLRLRKVVANTLAVLWVRHERQLARSVIEEWVMIRLVVTTNSPLSYRRCVRHLL